jgi:hypothetical protein
MIFNQQALITIIKEQKKWNYLSYNGLQKKRKERKEVFPFENYIILNLKKIITSHTTTKQKTRNPHRKKKYHELLQRYNSENTPQRLSEKMEVTSDKMPLPVT